MLKGITTAANGNDVTQTLALVDGVPPVWGRPGRPRRRPESLLGDKGYDSNPHRDELRHRRILPVISRKGSPNIKGIGKLRYVVDPLRRRADLRPAPPLQTPRRPMGTPHRTPRRLRLPGLQPHLLEAPQQVPIMIVLRALCGRQNQRAGLRPPPRHAQQRLLASGVGDTCLLSEPRHRRQGRRSTIRQSAMALKRHNLRRPDVGAALVL
ncbi:transposase [Streptomyces anulatus]